MRTLNWINSQTRAFAEALPGDRRGIAGIEFALVGGTLCFLILNLIDVSGYLYMRMQVHNAAQVGALAAWKACDSAHVPATTSCSGLTTAVVAAIQSTTLGTKVKLQSGSPSEGYYCINATNALQYVSAVASKPSNCSVAGMAALQPGDYLSVAVTYAYAPIFGDLTAARFFATPITHTARIRLL